MDAYADAIEQLGETIPRQFTLRGDDPPELLGENTGPTAAEILLAALGSRVAGTPASPGASDVLATTARGTRRAAKTLVTTLAACELVRRHVVPPGAVAASSVAARRAPRNACG